MRKLTFSAICAFLTIGLFAQQQESDSYIMVETIYLTPDYSHIGELSEAMTNHNKKYHQSGPYSARVYNVSTGPNVGQLVWVMGPLTYSDLDSRPGADGHDEDWDGKVMPHVKKLNNGEYWRMDKELSNVDPSEGPFNIIRLRFHELKPGQGYRAESFFKRISDTVKKLEGNNPWAVYYNEWIQGYKIGRHIATVSYHDNWSEMDEKNELRKTFNEVHGENAWQDFINDADNIFADTYDEFWVLNKKLSGLEE